MLENCVCLVNLIYSVNCPPSYSCKNLLSEKYTPTFSRGFWISLLGLLHFRWAFRISILIFMYIKRATFLEIVCNYNPLLINDKLYYYLALLSDQWNWVMEWSEMIPAHTMAGLLDRCFFPKWLQTLSVWLNLNPDFDQVGQWFRGWETLIPDSIREQPLVRGTCWRGNSCSSFLRFICNCLLWFHCFRSFMYRRRVDEWSCWKHNSGYSTNSQD